MFFYGDNFIFYIWFICVPILIFKYQVNNWGEKCQKCQKKSLKVLSWKTPFKTNTFHLNVPIDFESFTKDTQNIPTKIPKCSQCHTASNQVISWKLLKTSKWNAYLNIYTYSLKIFCINKECDLNTFNDSIEHKKSPREQLETKFGFYVDDYVVSQETGYIHKTKSGSRDKRYKVNSYNKTEKFAKSILINYKFQSNLPEGSSFFNHEVNFKCDNNQCDGYAELRKYKKISDSSPHIGCNADNLIDSNDIDEGAIFQEKFNTERLAQESNLKKN